MQDVVLTIFTPTYNRAYILPKLFNSLRNQTDLSFEWMIIDDGSSDGTKDLVDSFIKQADFKIKYFYKKNEGKHVAINMMLDNIDTELVLIVDSDDYLESYAVTTILEDYKGVADNTDVCELMYYRKHFNGKVIGEKFKTLGLINDPINEFINKGINGDRCNVVITKKIKKYRFPVFESEKFIGEGQLWYRMYKESAVYAISKSIYFCEYREDGLSKAGRRLRVRNPLGGMEYCKTLIDPQIKWTIRFKYMSMYICYGLLAKQPLSLLSKEYKKNFFILCLLPGSLLYLRWSRLLKK